MNKQGSGRVAQINWRLMVLVGGATVGLGPHLTAVNQVLQDFPGSGTEPTFHMAAVRFETNEEPSGGGHIGNLTLVENPFRVDRYESLGRQLLPSRLTSAGRQFAAALEHHVGRLPGLLNPVSIWRAEGTQERITYNRIGRRAEGSNYFRMETDRRLVGEDFRGNIDRQAMSWPSGLAPWTRIFICVIGAARSVPFSCRLRIPRSRIFMSSLTTVVLPPLWSSTRVLTSEVPNLSTESLTHQLIA